MKILAKGGLVALNNSSNHNQRILKINSVKQEHHVGANAGLLSA